MTDQIVLNRQQSAAAKHRKGPLLIVAGAGTGKTTVITERIKHLIQKRKIAPQNILAATFTEKAAGEMLERLDVAMPMGYEEPWLGTFHSICDRILRADGLAIGLDPGYKIIAPADQWILVKKNLFDFDLDYFRPLGNPTKFISALLTFFSRAQDEDVDPKVLAAFVRKAKKKAKTAAEREEVAKLDELKGAFKTYNAMKLEQSALDFGDLIIQTLKLFRKRRSVLEKYQKQFQHVLVDEFQDTNVAQFQFIKCLCPQNTNPNITVVGDDDQSIYKFRGASISNILEFKREYPKTHEIVLTQNYRSGKPILESVYQLITHNNPDRLEAKLGINKRLRAKRKIRFPPLIIHAADEAGEVDWTIQKTRTLLAKRRYAYKDIAILTRANAHLNPYVAGLKQHGLPYQLVTNRGLFDQDEIRTLIDFLRTVANPSDSLSLFQLLHLPPFMLPPQQVSQLLYESKKRRTPLWEVLKKQKGTKARLAVALINKFQERASKKSIRTLLHDFIYESGHGKNFIKQESVENQLKIKNINLFFERVRQFEAERGMAPLPEFVDALDLWQEAGESPAQAVIEDIDTINLLTVHAAKGLEFPVVFVGSLVAGRFPSINRRDQIEFPEALFKETIPKGSQSLQEERRLLYVAMTRARDHLFLSYASDYGGVRKRRPSGFLSEVGLKEEKPRSKERKVQLVTPPLPTKVRDHPKKGKTEIKHLSYSQINTFLTCPLKYKYRYVLNIPAEPHHSLSFGKTIHNTLLDFHRLQKRGRTVPLKKLLIMYEGHFIQAGYESEEHKKRRFQAGTKALKTYFKKHKDLLGKPMMLEKGFRLSIDGVVLVGKIDRIDEIDGGLEIVDYKTGKSGDQRVVDKDRQLTLYSLAAKEALGLEARKTSLYFIEENKKLTSSRSEQDLEKEREFVRNLVKKIETSGFPAKPGYPYPCSFCEYKRICPAAARKRGNR